MFKNPMKEHAVHLPFFWNLLAPSCSWGHRGCPQGAPSDQGEVRGLKQKPRRPLDFTRHLRGKRFTLDRQKVDTSEGDPCKIFFLRFKTGPGHS